MNNEPKPQGTTIIFSSEEYATLVSALSMTETIYGLLSDMVDEKYKKHVDRIEAIESLVLQHADEAGYAEDLYERDGKLSIFSESEAYEQMFDDLHEFEEWSLYENLANKLAWCDFRATHSEKEIRAMAKKHGGYLGVELYDFEKKYYDEFDKHGIDRLKIVD